MKPVKTTGLIRLLSAACIGGLLSATVGCDADEPSQSSPADTESQGAAAAEQDHRHSADPETIAFIRKIAPSMADRSDEEIVAMLAMMPPNYNEYLSEARMRGSTGVLVVTHGFGEVGDEIFAEALAPVANEYPTAVGFGMAMMTSEHIQAGVDSLVGAGAETIVAVPATQSRHDSGIRQYQYILGQREEPGYMAVPQVRTEARIVMTPPLADHPIISQILLDHANEISREPGNEVVIVVGHGPSDDRDNERELQMMQAHAEYISANSDYAGAQVINLQDDALKDTRAENVRTLRSLVEQANRDGHDVIVVGFLLGTAGIQPKIEQDLAGLDYRFNPKGMSENRKFAAWVAQAVTDAQQRLEASQ